MKGHDPAKSTWMTVLAKSESSEKSYTIVVCLSSRKLALRRLYVPPTRSQ